LLKANTTNGNGSPDGISDGSGSGIYVYLPNSPTPPIGTNNTALGNDNPAECERRGRSDARQQHQRRQQSEFQVGLSAAASPGQKVCHRAIVYEAPLRVAQTASANRKGVVHAAG
jgi:hypothetical protein